jgi:hypothetical protein
MFVNGEWPVVAMFVNGEWPVAAMFVNGAELNTGEHRIYA